MEIDLIVTRHAGAIEWLATQLDCAVGPNPAGTYLLNSAGVWIPVMPSVTARDVLGKHVCGNLPLHLAALCASVTAIEFAGDPPRGSEYGVSEMVAAGARLARYSVHALDGQPWICQSCDEPSSPEFLFQRIVTR